jgi:superfamily II DNA/RNA helicase
MIKKTRSFGSARPSSARPSSKGPHKSFSGKPGRKSFSKSSSFGGAKKAPFGRPSFGGGRRGARRSSGGKKMRGERIDYSRFISKAVIKKEEPYVNDHHFIDFPFVEKLQSNIARKGYIHPRPIQDKSIPHILKGKDVFGLANTGTGKTAAFLLPFINKVMQDKKEQVLVLAPTRELAIQIEEELRSLAFGSGLFGVSVVGGMPINKQITEIKRGVSFVIGTPGRVMDLIKRGILDLSNYKNIVLDEADRMLDMGFRDDMVTILSKANTDRQTLFFSATLSDEIKQLTSKFLKDPVFVSVIKGETSKNVNQDIVKINKENKFTKLCEILASEGTDKILIFREMKYAVDELEKELKKRGFKVGGIHGDKRSRERLRTLDAFKNNQLNILIATDVAARGLDIPDVSHVINYDIPQNYDTYVHRIGRTGRGDKTGHALTFVA